MSTRNTGNTRYLLKDLVITRPNHVWCCDITYIPMRRGFLYLVAVMELGDTQGPVLEAVEHHGGRLLHRGAGRKRWPAMASRRSSTPIKAASSPAPVSVDVLLDAGVRVSMDGKGRWMDKRVHRAALAVTEIRVRLHPLRSKPAPNCGQASETGSATTMPTDRPTRPLAGRPPMRHMVKTAPSSLIRG